MNLNVLTTADDKATHHQRWPWRSMVACGLVLLVGLAAFAVFSTDPWGERGSLPASFQLDFGVQVAIDPEQIHYQPQGQFELPLDKVSAISAGPLDEIYVAGDRAVHVFTKTGAAKFVVELDAEPSCLAVGGVEHIEPGRIYVGVPGGVRVFHPDGKSAASWQLPKQQDVLTCIAVAETDVFVADAGNRVVWRFDSDGQLVGQIGTSDTALEASAFVVSSPYFDVVVGSADLVHITNPGKLQVATYTFNGDFGKAWGQASSTLSGFFGCCNPSHLAMLPDGRFVTSEKGLPRIKVYSAQGEYESVVAGPEQLDVDKNAVGDPRCTDNRFIFDIAVDSQGRILVLDANHNEVLIFVAKDRELEAG